MTHPDPEQVVPTVQLYILVWKPARELKANVLRVARGDFRQPEKFGFFFLCLRVVSFNYCTVRVKGPLENRTVPNKGSLLRQKCELSEYSLLTR